MFSVMERNVLAEGGFADEPWPSNKSSTGVSDSGMACAANDVVR